MQGGFDEWIFGAFHHAVQQGIDAFGQPGGLELLDAGQRVTGLQQLEHLVEQAALGYIGQQGQRGRQRRFGLGVELEPQSAELGTKTHRTDDAYRVLSVTAGRVTDHAQHALLGITDAMVKIDHGLGFRIVVHGIDGEIAANGVVLDRAPDVVAQHPPTGIDGVLHAGQFAFGGALVAAHLLGSSVVHVGAKGGHLDHFMLAPAPEDHMHDAEAPSNDEGAPEEGLDLFRRGIGGDVKILGAQPQQQVAHRATHDVSLVTSTLEGVHHVQRAAVNQRWVDPMDGGRHVLALAEIRPFGLGRLAQQFVDEGLDHGCSANRSRMRQPRSRACWRRPSPGLVATGTVTRSSRGRSLVESE